MRLKTGKTDVWEGIYCVRNTFQILLFPNVLWAFCLNGLTIGTNVSIGTTFGTVMTSVYGWPDRSSSYVNAGQIVVAIVGLPILGYGSDKLITWKASRNNGVHEPESRLMLLGLPLSVGVMGAVIYGQAAEYPEKLHWFAIVAAIAMYYFAFVGGNIAAITYLLDSYPARAGPCLIVITVFRGFVSFGVSYGISDFIESHGYDGCFGTFGGLTAAFAVLAIPIYFFGKRIRRFTGKWSVKEKPTRPSMAR
ncbi:MFS general substrate transporter [Hortaea werneckii]|nr:MFS general substrate transporter [Hortaea werneckii]